MTNEAVKVELTNGTGFPRRYTCAAGVGIAKGTLLKLTDPRTASAVTAGAKGEALAGIASMEKVSTDGSTSISCWTDGIFEMVASGAIVLGSPVVAAGQNNMIEQLSLLAASGAMVLGYAMETAANAETINVRVRL